MYFGTKYTFFSTFLIACFKARSSTFSLGQVIFTAMRPKRAARALFGLKMQKDAEASFISVFCRRERA
jgi:hypothetical protein